MERLIELFINTEDGEFYDRGGLLAAYDPAINAGELVRLTVQLCAGVPAFNSTGALLNPDTTFAGTLAAAETIIDNNFNWYDKGTLLENLTTGTAISELSVASEAAPRQLGAVRLNAGTVVNFCGWTATEGGYRLTLADNEFNPAQFTPTANFAQGAAVEVLEQPIIVSAQNDDSGRATGLFTGLLDAANPVYESMIEGHEDIPNCRIEFSIYQDGRAVFRARRYFDCLGAMAMNKGAAYVHSDSWREADSRYIKLVDWQAPPEYQFSEDGTNWHDQQQNADLYYHERRPGGQWGAAVKMKTGPTGAAAGFGTPSVTVETLQAGSDATASVTASGDNTAKVFSFNFGIPKGADGQNGTNGADGAAGADGVSSYTYVAYASDASGTGFSLTPTNALKYRAEIHTTTAIETPDAEDFAGATWVKYIGDDGTGAGDMTKSVYDTNDDGIVDHAAAADAVGATTAAQVADAVAKAHTHANKATLDKLAEADGKLTFDGAEIGGASNWNDITGKPSTFPPSAHNHAITDVTGLEDALQNAGSVKSVNGQLPDESGNVTVETGGAVDESRLLPENPANGDIPCFDATATIGGGNDANTRLLLQPSTSDHGIVDQAAGNAAPVTLENHNVTVDEEGNMVFDGSNAYLKIPANTLPSDFFNGTDEWTLDIVYNVASKSMQCLFGCSSSLRMDFLLDSNGLLQIGGGPNLGTGWPFNEDVHLTFEIYKDGTVWKYTIFRNGSVVTTGTWVNADWRSVAQYIGWEGESDSRKINGKIKALRLTSGALHKGAAFQSDYPWTKPQTVGEWGKINKSELALKTDLANKADKTALLGKADKSQLSAYQPLLPVEKQLPAAVNEDELIMSKITTSTVPGANNETVKFLLQPATSNNQVVDSAAGNETPLTFTNNGVTADSDGIMTFSPTQYAVIPAGTVTAGLIDILLNIPTVPDDNVEYVLFGNGPDSNSGGDGFYVCLRGGTLYLCSGNGNVDSLGSYTANTWVNITLGYNGPTANADRNIGYWLNGAGHTVNWNTAGHTYSYNPFSHDFYLGKTDQSSTGLTWKAKVVRLRNTVEAISWYPYNDTTTITVDDYPYQKTVQKVTKSWVRSTIAQLEAKMNVATASAAGLMAAADKVKLDALQQAATYINTATDFDTYKTAGSYFLKGAVHTNGPLADSYAGTLVVVALAEPQYATQYFTQLYTNTTFVRTYAQDSSAWSAWRRIIVDANITESKARPGYFKLPGGTIVQWGAVLNITADGTTSATLPIAFPNSAFVATATATGSGLIASVAFDGNSKLNVIVKGYPGSGNFTIYWIAIGY